MGWAGIGAENLTREDLYSSEQPSVRLCSRVLTLSGESLTERLGSYEHSLSSCTSSILYVYEYDSNGSPLMV